MFLSTILSLIATGLVGTGNAGIPDSNIASTANTFGNSFNFWVKSANGGWDLTRGETANSIKLPVPGGPITIAPNKSAMVIIDMQNFFLHPDLGGDPKGRAIVPTTISMIKAFRAKGMKVIWTNWGLTEFDLTFMPPAFIRGFSSDGTSATSFGSDMGTIEGNITVGRKLMRGSWNAQPWGDLFTEQVAGVAAGTDVYYNKNRLSGMWGPSTPMQMGLQDLGITTLFFGGVNIDQCVWGTLLDSYYKGYDVILVDDISATTSPLSATQMTDFNAGLDGWRANTTDILPALK